MRDTRFARVMRARDRVAAERAWIEEHGGSLSGYIARYGSADDTDRHGDGGRAIYEADRAALVRAKVELDRARGEAS